MNADQLTQARIAENQSTFRAANENIEDAAGEIGVDEAIPFICECPDPDCLAIVRLDPEEYEEVRRHPRRFFTAPGHETISVESGAGVVLENRDDHAIVEKVGLAGELAEELADG